MSAWEAIALFGVVLCVGLLILHIMDRWDIAQLEKENLDLRTERYYNRADLDQLGYLESWMRGESNYQRDHWNAITQSETE